MKADERSMADSQAVVYRGSLTPDRRFSFSLVVLVHSVWLVVRLGYFQGNEATFSGEQRYGILVKNKR